MRVAQLQAQNEELLSSSKKQALGPEAVSDRRPRLREDFVPRRDEDVVRSMRDRQLDMQDAKAAGNAHELARLCQVVVSTATELSKRSRLSIVANAVRVIEEQDLCPIGSNKNDTQAILKADDAPRWWKRVASQPNWKSNEFLTCQSTILATKKCQVESHASLKPDDVWCRYRPSWSQPGPEWRMQIVTRSMATLTEARLEVGEHSVVGHQRDDDQNVEGLRAR